LLLLVASLSAAGCGSSNDEADQQRQRAEQTREASDASAKASETSALADQIAQLPATLKKPGKTISRARSLKAQAKELAKEQAPAGNDALDQPYQDLQEANQQLARSSGKIQATAVEVKDGSRDPDLAGAKRSLRRANRLMLSAYNGIDEFVTTELSGALSVQRPADVQLAKAKLPPLPDLVFNFLDSGEAQVGDWQPSPQNSDFQGAVANFGPPDIPCGSEGAGDSTGVSEWLKLGLQVTQADFGGGGGACAGAVQIVEVRGSPAKQWVTDAGLRVGDPASRVRELYPDTYKSSFAAQPSEEGLVLASTGGPLPYEFIALIEGGSVAGMRIWIGGAGE
jgi:hypothetical protein